MRILHVEAGRHLYGGAQQVLYLMEVLNRWGHENLLVCPVGSEIAERARAVAEVVALPMSGDLDALLYGRLRAVAKRFNPHVIHGHSRRGADLYPGLVAAGLGVRSVLSRRVDNREPVWLARFRASLFDRVVGISQGIVEVQRSLGVPSSKLVCVRSAVDPTPFLRPIDRAALRADLGLPSEARIIAVVAQLIERKGHRLLLESLEPLWSVYPDWHVLFYGRGPLESDLRSEIVRRGWSDRVRLMGFVPHLADHLGGLDLLVHPAYAEGLGVSLLQAAAAGLPIISTQVGGIPEAVLDGEGGLLLPPGQSRPLTQALRTLMDSEALRIAMGAAGRRRVLQEFSIEEMARGNLAVYQSLLDVKS
ncbi:MAG: glycosyltransferase family 4 protein [Burkholderiaceae bacterium]